MPIQFIFRSLSLDGRIYSWGDNEYGQLGLGEKGKYSSTPNEVIALCNLPIYMIAAGGAHCFAMTISGTLFGWGKNRYNNYYFEKFINNIKPTVAWPGGHGDSCPT